METDKLMAALQVANQKEQVPIEWKPCVTGEEEIFTKALQHNPINKSTVEELKQVLKLVMIKVGIRANNLPNDVEKEVLIEHIITNYGNHTPMEIKLAFDMAVSGKLDDMDSKGNVIDLETNCYENFSCLYFSKIMNSYRRWARQTHNQLKDYPKMIAEKLTLSDEEKAEWIMEWKQNPDIILELIPLVFYDWMDEKKLLKITKEDKWKYTEQATAQIKSELFNETTIVKTNNDAYIAYNKFCNMEKEGFSGENKGRIVNRAKRLIIYDYLKGKIE